MYSHSGISIVIGPAKLSHQFRNVADTAGPHTFSEAVAEKYPVLQTLVQ